MTTETIDEPQVEEVVTPLEPPRHPQQTPFPPVGIYFGMPHETYHSIPACSASGLKHLSISSMDYWARSLLNLDREDDEVPKDSGQLTPRQLGQAYHTYICEGMAAFVQRYAITLDKERIREVTLAKGLPFCVTVSDLRQAIDEAGGKPKGTSKEPLIDQLLEFVPGAVVWDRLVAKHLAVNFGKTMITPKLHRRIAVAEAMISGDPKLGKAFRGGHAEVSIFWFDEKTGVPMKARLDYLKMNTLVDLKSFGNQQGKPIQRAIDAAIANNKYYLPVVVYLEAIAAAKQMIRDTKSGVFQWYEADAPGNEGGDAGHGTPAHELYKWCWDWAHQPEPEVLFIFQQTGIAPVTRGRIMPTGNHYVITQGAVQDLKAKWRHCAETYGVDPWVDFEPVRTTADEEVGPWASDFGTD